jgi:hypothetical protein
MAEHQGLPVAGYAPTQSTETVDLVNEGKILEERCLRYIDQIKAGSKPHEPRFLATGRTDIQKGFMMVFRSIFQPVEPRIALPEDKSA